MDALQKKKKRSLPKFDNYFLQLIIVTANFSYRCPKNYGFAQIFSCHFPKNFNFCPNLELPPAPPAGKAMHIYIVFIDQVIYQIFYQFNENFVATDMLLYISQCYKTKKKTKSGPVKFESQIILF